ncbi:hypothetical protein GCM10010207_88270 [Streptomyces atratus]|uniref:DUF6461 domain-containing protein n=1 Tax=Streptomyces atratus TaxID=1893 RepID=UPI00198912E1|nr:hypothetical protein GCM10010207_88270 [Streptomyces atratus]
MVGDQWEWATDPRYPLWCVTFTKGLMPDEVLRRYGTEPDQARKLAHTEASDLYDMALRGGGAVLRVGKLQGWSFCFEDVGGVGSRRGPLSALSRGTETLSLLRGGDGMNRLAYWCDGQRRESFEPGANDRMPQGERHFWDLVCAYDQATPGRTGLLLALQAITQHTGVSLDTATIAGPLLTAHLSDGDRTPDPVQRAPLTMRGSAASSLGRPLGSVSTFNAPKTS